MIIRLTHNDLKALYQQGLHAIICKHCARKVYPMICKHRTRNDV